MPRPAGPWWVPWVPTGVGAWGGVTGQEQAWGEEGERGGVSKEDWRQEEVGGGDRGLSWQPGCQHPGQKADAGVGEGCPVVELPACAQGSLPRLLHGAHASRTQGPSDRSPSPDFKPQPV